jgi:hypothetical protein
LKKNSIKQTYICLIDSKNRDFENYPDPNNYVVNFDVPIKNVIGFDIIDTSIPRTMYSIDKYNNSFYYYVHSNSDIDDFNNKINSIDMNIINDPTYNGVFKEYFFEAKDYNTQTFITAFNQDVVFTDKDVDFYVSCISNPTQLTDVIQFNSSKPFIINMKDSTVAETLGFDLYANKKDHNIKYIYNNHLNSLKIKKFFVSREMTSDEITNLLPKNTFLNRKTTLIHNIIAPGMVCFTGEKYILMRSPEIEEYSFGSLAYSNNNLGIAKFRTNSIGFNDEKMYVTKIPIREFHPIGKLAKLTLRFETSKRLLYDFKGINHNITIAIYYYEPKINKIEEFNSILNPNYTLNFNDYNYTNEEEEILINDEQELKDEFLSRDNINDYKIMEQKYNY